MRSAFIALLFTLAGCPSRAAPDGAAPDAPLPRDARSLTPPVDAVAPSAVQLRLRGRPAGYVRFVHLVPGLGPLHFVGRNVANYEDSHVDAVVAPGAASPYLLTIAVPHRVDVYPAGANPDAGAPLTTDPLVDVYNGTGCTAVLIGLPPPAPSPARARLRNARNAPDARYALHITNVVDLHRRGTADTALLRFYNALPSVRVPLTVREGERTVVEELEFGDVTGVRELPAGAHSFTLVSTVPDAGVAAIELAPVRVPANEAHTLWVFDSDSGPRTLLTDDTLRAP